MKSKKQLKKQMENKTVLIWKMGIASALSWEIAKLAGSNHPYLAPISVILCLQTTIDRSIRFSYHRMAGTVIGIIVVVLLEPFLKVNGWTIGGLILIGCFIAKWLKREESAIHQAALTVLLVFVLGHKSGDYPIDRFRDTLIGAIAAVIIQMIIHPPNYSQHALKKSIEYSTVMTKSFTNIAQWIDGGIARTEETEIQNLLKKLEQELQLCKFVLKDAKESLKYNFFAQKSQSKLKESEQRIKMLSEGLLYLKHVVDTYMAWSKTGTITTKERTACANQLTTLAPFFSREKDDKLQGNLLTISIPKELEKQQYLIALYHQTSLLIEKIKKEV
ncbi:FUSC family protein [Neobacillus vireti]|uniref:FUSC family protein n=1 Tax=Neobacillus vireti TaxID=220686 RepID=UPI002FFD7EFE